MRKKMKQLMGILLSIVLAFGLMPGMSFTAYAYTGSPYERYVGDVEFDVYFGGKLWTIIKDEAYRETVGKLTLLAADTSFGLHAFNSVSNSKYSSSSIKEYLDAQTMPGGSMYDVADAILSTTVQTTNDADVDQKLYLLSKEEVQGLATKVISETKFPPQ